MNIVTDENEIRTLARRDPALHSLLMREARGEITFHQALMTAVAFYHRQNLTYRNMAAELVAKAGIPRSEALRIIRGERE